MVDKKQIREVFEKYFDCAEPVKIYDDGEISTRGYVSAMRDMKKLPLRFNVVGGFDVGGCKLETLAGSPQWVLGEFRCISNQLQTLEGGPQGVLDSFLCGFNQLEDLKGAPKKVKKLSCVSNPLKSLDGLPDSLEELILIYDPKLPLLRALTAKKITFTHRLGDDPAPETLVEILNTYAGQGKMAIFDCQKDLEDAGFEENAKW
jgi:hypothetical protein